MMHKSFKPTPLAAGLQTASLLVIAGGLFVILISDIIQHRAEVAKVEAPSQMQLFALPHASGAN